MATYALGFEPSQSDRFNPFLFSKNSNSQASKTQTKQTIDSLAGYY